MKNLIIFVLSFLLYASTIHATVVPVAVKNAFQKKFPNAKKVKWEKEKTNEYEASFKLDRKEVSALYLTDGKLIEVETEIFDTELPKPVAEILNKKYPNIKISEVSKIERSDNSIVYEAELKIGGKKIDLLFDEKGNVLN
jgi:hypothetical protein